MYESPAQYQAIVNRQVHVLERACRCRIIDGERAICPRCGETGTWDIETKGFRQNYGNSIYYSTVYNEWRCRICDIRRYW